MKTDLIKINKEQGLYVLKCGTGFTCLGFDVCDQRTKAICNELKLRFPNKRKGTKTHYETYIKMVQHVANLHKAIGFRSKSQLNPKLIGLEGKRIECNLHGVKTRFIVGKSTGFIPCHLEIKTSRSSGGGSITSDPKEIHNIRVI